MHARHLAATAAAFLLAVFTLPAIGATPDSFRSAALPLERVAGIELGALDLDAIATEDALREAEGGPQRFAMPHEVAIDVQRDGTWEEDGSRSIWRYRVQAPAASLNFAFTHYRLPASAQLWLYDSTGSVVAGPWGMEKNKPHGQLWTPIIPAGDVVIELDVDSAERARVELLLGRINQGYRGLGGRTEGYRQPDVGDPKEGKTACTTSEILSGQCNMDVACLAPDDPWNDPRRAVGAITTNGIDTCTGSLINNTAGDRRGLFATATHCGLTQSSAPSVVIYWNYEWPTCRTPGTSASGQVGAPDPNMASSGTTFLAATPSPFTGGGCSAGISDSCTDWTLVEIDDPLDTSWDLYWEGWDRRSVGAVCSEPADPTSTEGLCASIHHPNVDEKRITFVRDTLTTSGIASGTNSHWHARWDPTPPILPGITNPPSSLPPGVTEPGSSGSPLYSGEQRIVGVLSGGNSYCGATGSSLSDDYGQLAIAWEGRGTPTTRMRDHLDPLGTGAQFIDGMGMSPFTLEIDPPALAACSATDASASAQVTVVPDPGFTAPVALAASGAPAGTNVSFSPASVTPPGNATLTIADLAGAAPGSYDITVNGTSGGDSASRSLQFTLSAAIAATPTPTAPADGADEVSPATVLSWSAPGGEPADYEVQVATDPGFANIVFSRTVSDGTSVTVSPALDVHTDYWWRVRAVNGCGDSAWSAPSMFTTGQPFPQPYCAVNFSSAVEPITRVVLADIDNASPVSSSDPHEDFLGVSGGDVENEASYDLRVEGTTAGDFKTWVSAYFDWDRDGSFDASEKVSIGMIENSTGSDGKHATAAITVPEWVSPGPVRMRVLKKWSAEAPDACNSGGSGYGQAEDYTLQVGGAVPTWSVGGSATGVAGQAVTLGLNGSETLVLTADGGFSFTTELEDGEAWAVSIDEVRGIAECTLANASGVIAGADVDDVTLSCTVPDTPVDPDDLIFADGFEAAD